MQSKFIPVLTVAIVAGLGASYPSWAAGISTNARPIQLAQSSSAAEDIFWQSIQSSTDPAMFQAYLDQVKNGTFKGTYKPLAEIKINSLGKGAPSQAPAAPASSQTPPPPAPTRTVPDQDASSPEIEACDRAAGHPQDDQRPANIPGVTASKLDTSSAIVACLKATKVSNAPSREYFQLGRAYDKSGNPKDASEAYKQAAERGHPRAGFNLAMIYMYGKGGVRKDPGLALSLLEKAVDAKVNTAFSGLGDYYRLGTGGRRDYAKAIDYYNQAIAADDATGYGLLGVMAYNGNGMSRNRNKACDYWQQGARLGDENSGNNIKKYCKFR